MLDTATATSHSPIIKLAPHSGNRRERVTLLDRSLSFIAAGKSASDTDVASLLSSYLTQSQHVPGLAALRDCIVSPVIDSIVSASRTATARDKQQFNSQERCITADEEVVVPNADFRG